MEQEIYKCEYCDAEFDDAAKLRGHNMTCKPKHTKITTDTRKVTRENRVPFGVMEQRFGDIPDDDFRYHVFNDKWQKDPGRIERALRAGYERVDHPNSGKPVGTNDNGTQIIGVLMRIPKEWHEEDKAKREAELLETERQITEGAYQKQAGDGRYVPKEGISIGAKLTP